MMKLNAKKPSSRQNSSRKDESPSSKKSQPTLQKLDAGLDKLLFSFGLNAYTKRLMEHGQNSENVFKIAKLPMKEREALILKLRINTTTKAKFNTMVEMLKYMDDEKSSSTDLRKSSSSIKTKNVTRERKDSLSRQESSSKKVDIATNLKLKEGSRPSSSANHSIVSNSNPYDPKNLKDKNSGRRLSRNTSSQHRLVDSSRHRDNNSSNNSWSYVDVATQTNPGLFEEMKKQNDEISKKQDEKTSMLKLRDDTIRKLKADLEKLNETNLILRKKNTNLESDIELFKQQQPNSQRSLKMDSTERDIQNESRSIEKSVTKYDKFDRIRIDQSKSNNLLKSDEQDEVFEVTDTFNQNEIKCGLSYEKNNNKTSNPSIQTNKQSIVNIHTEIESEQELESHSTLNFEFNKTKDEINKSSIISTHSNSKFNNFNEDGNMGSIEDTTDQNPTENQEDDYIEDNLISQILNENNTKDEDQAITYDDFQRTNDFGKCDFLTFYKCLAQGIHEKLCKNNANFIQVYSLLKLNQTNQSTFKRGKRSNSQTKNPQMLSMTGTGLVSRKDSRESVGSSKGLREEDWDLSCTLDMTTKYLQKTNKCITNSKMHENVFNAFVDDSVQDNMENHLKLNSKNVEVDQIQYFLLSTHVNCRLEKECAIIANAYLEKIEKKAGYQLMSSTWRRLTLTAIILASKVWDDESFENQHFSKTLEIPVTEINTLERLFLVGLDQMMNLKLNDYQQNLNLMKKFSKIAEKNKKLSELDKDLIFRFGYTSEDIDFEKIFDKKGMKQKKKLSEKLGRNLSLSF